MGHQLVRDAAGGGGVEREQGGEGLYTTVLTSTPRREAGKLKIYVVERQGGVELRWLSGQNVLLQMEVFAPHRPALTPPPK